MVRRSAYLNLGASLKRNHKWLIGSLLWCAYLASHSESFWKIRFYPWLWIHLLIPWSLTAF